MVAQSTPLMEQYDRIKRAHGNHILFFRMGDFYEMFGEDAKVASRVLGIALTTRDKNKEQPIPLAGVPWHAADAYIGRMIQAGYSVAVCEQVEDPKAARGLVRREVVRVVTPGTALSPDILEAGSNRFLAAVARSGGLYGLAHLDLSTGEFFCQEAPEEEILSEVGAVSPTELLVPASFEGDGTLRTLGELLPETTLTERDDLRFDRRTAYDTLTGHLKTHSLEAFGCEEMDAGLGAAGAILDFVEETQGAIPEHIDRLTSVSERDYLVMDATAQRLLELLPERGAGRDQTDLFQVLNHTRTAMGSRLLRQWIQRPLVDPYLIAARQDVVDFLFQRHTLRDQIRRHLRQIGDVERLVGRIACERANARDLVSLKNSLAAASELRAEIAPAVEGPIDALIERVAESPAIVDELDRALVDDPPVTLKEGGLIRDGYHEELDRIRQTLREGKQWIARLQEQERGRTGIGTLKVGYNKVFGYYLEVTRPHLDSVPPDYIRRQTLVGSERFVTPALKEKESKILAAEGRIGQMEYDLFQDLRRRTALHRREIQDTARAVAELDVFQSLAGAAVQNRYTRPTVDRSRSLEIKDGRHPMVEYYLAHQAFVPNDVRMDSGDRQILIITGPNMAGKSTYLRQVALIVILAQMGSFVPAAGASIGVTDRIFTRIGATEALSRGKSTFLVEMTEVAYILHHSTPRSLVLLDEVGRGTSTYDGISIAWAVAEYLHGDGEEGPKTLFATHYHELTELGGLFRRIHNLNVEVREWNDEIVFLRKVVDGGADRSYGIHAARVAGLPPQVLRRARQILGDLESGRSGLAALGASTPRAQMDLFEPRIPAHLEALADEIRALDPDRLTPLEALAALHNLKERVEPHDREDSGSPRPGQEPHRRRRGG